MIKKMLATAAVTFSVIGAGAAMATPAMAIADDDTTVNGNGASQTYGNTAIQGDYSPQIGLIQGSLNKPCIGALGKANVGSVVGVVPVTVQDILTSNNNQQCVENSTQIDGDDPLSHILSEIPVLSSNG
ncbi:RdlA protein [Streptomyces sp. A3M-1-3]|uniref:rodlin n=1 Tax=Streptomyces sp. A3M-1-3 TaxID=2962044 RepID=UPI0020B786DA|nr:rodlin [Streptomyces sp. A3M-1-3]MCP3820362.1 RdlA protein [Streptomyces sp. A3M-1-3]